MVQLNLSGIVPSGVSPGSIGSGNVTGPRLPSPYTKASDYEKGLKAVQQQNAALEAARNRQSPAMEALARQQAQEAARKTREETEGFRTIARSNRETLKAELTANKQMRELTKRQVKGFEAHVAAEAKLQQDRLKRQKESEEAQRRLEAHQARLAMQRGQQQWALHRVFSHLQHAGTAHLTPRGWENIQHRGSILRERIEAFNNRWGTAPDIGGNLDQFLASTGTRGGTYPIRNIVALGSKGQRAAEGRQWIDLARVNKELKRIDSHLQRQFKFQNDPTQRAILQFEQQQVYVPEERVVGGGEHGGGAAGGGVRGWLRRRRARGAAPMTEAERANLDRQQKALNDARAQISAGMSGNSRLTNFAGGIYGRGGLLLKTALENPFVSGALAGGMLMAESGYVVNQLYASVMGQGQPYRNFRQQLDLLALGGGFSAGGAQRNMLRQGGWNYLPGNALTERMRAWGFDPETVLRLQQSAGYLPHSSSGMLRLAEGSRLFSMQFGMGLNEQQLAQTGGAAKSVFGMAPDRYFRKLYEVEVNATARGMNNSTVAAGFQTLINSAASRGPASVGMLSSYYSHMITGGGPLMRAGGAAAYASNVAGAMQHLSFGGNPATTMAVAGFLNRHGWAATPGAFQKEFGIKGGQFASMMKGGGKRIWQAYVASVKAGNKPMAEEYLGALLANNPHELTYMLKHSGVSFYSSPVFGLFGRSVATHSTMAQEASAEAGFAYAPLTAPAVPRRAVYGDIAKWAHKYGIPLKDMLGLVGKESSFNVYARNGSHLGLGQIGVGTGKDAAALAAWNKAHPGNQYTAQDMYNPDKNAQVTAWYFKQMYLGTGARSWGSAYEAYHWGLGGGARYNESDLMAFRGSVNNYRGQGAYTAMRRRSALGATAGLTASEFADKEYQFLTRKFTDIADHVTVVFKDIENAGHDAAKALGAVATNAMHAAGAIHRMGAGNMGLMGAPTFMPSQMGAK